MNKTRIRMGLCLCLLGAWLSPAFSGELDEQEAAGAIAVAQNSKMDLQVRIDAVRLLDWNVKNRGQGPVVDSLIAILDTQYGDDAAREQEERKLRVEAVYTLGRLYSKNFTSSFPDLKVLAFDAGTLNKVIAALLKTLEKDPSQEVRNTVAERFEFLVGKMSQEQLKALAKLGLDPNLNKSSRARESVARALRDNEGTIQNPDAEFEQILQNAMDPSKETQSDVRYKIAQVIGKNKLNHPKLVQALRNAADPKKETEGFNREQALKALGLLGNTDPETFALLAKSIDKDKEPDQYVRSAAVEALGCINHPQSCYLLGRALDSLNREQQGRIPAWDPLPYRIEEVQKSLDRVKSALKSSTMDGASGQGAAAPPVPVPVQAQPSQKSSGK